MKTRRILSVFLLVILVFSFYAVPFALADETNGPVMPEDPDILAKAALLVDVETDTIVYGKNETEQLYPASLTKVMTALLVLEAIEDGKLSMDVTKEALNMADEIYYETARVLKGTAYACEVEVEYTMDEGKTREVMVIQMAKENGRWLFDGPTY